MPTLYANCPATGAVIETGTQCDTDSLRAMGESRVAVWCEKCRRHHVMRVSDLVCRGEEPVAA